MTEANEVNGEATVPNNAIEHDTLEAAREAGNTWKHNGKEMEMYVARGETVVETIIKNRSTGEDSGARLRHYLKWGDNGTPFIEREASFKTSLRRVGRSNEQEIDVAHQTTVNSKFYRQIIDRGELVIPTGNNQFDVIPKTLAEMIRHSEIYPESASEAIESWLECGKCSILEDEAFQFAFLFETSEFVKVLWTLGNKDNPVAAAVLTFKAPDSETRRNYEQEVQKVKSKKQGETSVAELSDNFLKKISYGQRHLMSVEGIAVGKEGVKFNRSLGADHFDEFITKFNPIWFAEAVEVMHESFDFMRGESGNS